MLTHYLGCEVPAIYVERHGAAEGMGETDTVACWQIGLAGKSGLTLVPAYGSRTFGAWWNRDK